MLLKLTEPENDAYSRKRRMARFTVEVVTGVIGVTLLVCAARADRSWLDRHMLPSFLFSRDLYVTLQTIVRAILAVVGALLLFLVRPRIGRFAHRAPDRVAAIVIAAVFAIVATEPVLRRAHWRPIGWLVPDEEPLRRPDSRLGWTFVPSRTGHATTAAGRTVEYALDAAGERARRVDEPVDREQPTIVFTGESIVFGEGLSWEETIPAQVSALTAVQTANLAVHGYATDQAFLRLLDDLPRFRKPVAVVSLFMPTLFGRNLDSERPHLGPGLTWRPAVQRWRLSTLARLFVPYRSDRVINEGITTTREVLSATAALARSRGATSLIVIPQFGPEPEPERTLRERIFGGSGLSVLSVSLDPTWRQPWDRHPDARAARAIAAAIAARLQGTPGLAAR